MSSNLKVSVSKRKLLLAFFSIALICSLASGSIMYVVAQGGSTPITISSGIYPGAPNYTLWVDGSTYYLKNSYGVTTSSTNPSTLMQTTLTANPTATFFIKNGVYTFPTGLIGKITNSIIGESKQNTILKFSQIDGTYSLDLQAVATTASGPTLKDFTLMPSDINGFVVTTPYVPSTLNCLGIKINSGTAGSTWGTVIQNLWIEGFKNCLYLKGLYLVDISNCKILGYRADETSTICLDNSYANIVNCDINSCTGYGGLYLINDAFGYSLAKITDSFFEASAGATAPFIYLSGTAVGVEMENSLLTGGTTNSLINGTGTKLVLDNCRLSGVSVASGNSVIDARGITDVRITDSQIAEYDAQYGIRITNPSAKIQSCTFIGGANNINLVSSLAFSSFTNNVITDVTAGTAVLGLYGNVLGENSIRGSVGAVNAIQIANNVNTLSNNMILGAFAVGIYLDNGYTSSITGGALGNCIIGIKVTGVNNTISNVNTFDCVTGFNMGGSGNYITSCYNSTTWIANYNT
jgi:hypothetical protein